MDIQQFENMDLNQFSEEQLRKMVLDFDISMPLARFGRFYSLSQQLNKSVFEVIEMCMYEKCEEYLEMFEKNTPENIDWDGKLKYIFNYATD